MRISDWSSDIAVSSARPHRAGRQRQRAVMQAKVQPLAKRLFCIAPPGFVMMQRVNAPRARFLGDLDDLVDAVSLPQHQARWEERRVGKEGVSTFRSRGSPYH